MEDQSLFDWLGISGILAILGAAWGYGQLHGRVKNLEERDKSQENAVSIAELRVAFEERTAAMQQDIQTIKEAVTRKH